MLLLEINAELFDTIWDIASVVYFTILLLIVLSMFLLNNKVHAWKIIKFTTLPTVFMLDSLFAIGFISYISIPCIIVINIIGYYVYNKLDVSKFYNCEIKGGYAIWESQRNKQMEQAKFSQLQKSSSIVSQKSMQIHPIWYGAVTTVSIIFTVFINSLYF